MKTIDFKAIILNSNNKPIMIRDEEGNLTGEPTTLLHIAEQALISDVREPNEEPISRSEKAKRYKLFNKISSGQNRLETEEISLIKTMIAKAWTTLIMGRAFDLIEAENSLKPGPELEEGKA